MKPVLTLLASALATALALPAIAANNEMEEIVVTAHKRDYKPEAAQSAVGLNLAIMETPAAISVVSADLLADQQVTNVDEALRNVAGVTKFKTGNGGEEKFSLRGFDASQSIYKDGARINNALNASNIPSTETANIERIEVLKGSAALIYGQGEPGGVINYITKRPEFERATTLEVMGGSNAFYKGELDTTGAFGDSDTFAYRLVASYEDSENYRDYVFRERLMLNPSVALRFNNQASLVLGYEFLDDDYTQDRGQVLDGNNDDGYSYSGRQDGSQFYGIPGWNDQTTAESSRLYLQADYQFNSAWRMELNYSATENDKVNVDSSPSYIDGSRGVIGAPGTPVENLVAIGPRKTDGSGDADLFNLKSFLDFEDMFGFSHQTLATVSYESFSTESTSFRADRVVMYDVVTRDYFSQHMDPVASGLEEVRLGDNILFGMNNRGASVNQEFEESGLNVLDYIRFNDHWGWLIGGRFSRYEDTLSDFEDDNFSLRTGLVYNVNPDLSIYGSYAQGYSNSAGRLDRNGDGIDPELSDTWELGAKWQVFDERLLVTATLYRVDKEDVPYVVNPEAPAGEQYYANLGGLGSQGVEIEAVGQITENWRIQAGYAFIDMEITEGGIGEFSTIFPEGNTLGGIAENNFNLFTFYELNLFQGDLGLGGGLYYQDEVFISTENRGTYDAWTQVDLASYYKQGKWKFQLNLNNVLDEDYRQAQALTTTDSFAAIRVGTATPRSVIASVAMEF